MGGGEGEGEQPHSKHGAWAECLLLEEGDGHVEKVCHLARALRLTVRLGYVGRGRADKRLQSNL